MNVIPTRGHNNPPADLCPFSMAEARVDELYSEAKNWADGEPITNQLQANEIDKLLSHLRVATKEAEASRKAEKTPFDEAAKEVQAKYKPLLDKADSASKALKAVLAPFLQKLEDTTREQQRIEREKAEKLRKEAEQAMRAASVDDLAGRAEAEAKLNQAKAQEGIAAKAAKSKAQAKGSVRATALRTRYVVEITDMKAFAAHVWQEDRHELEVFLSSHAALLVRKGARTLPGCEIREEKVL